MKLHTMKKTHRGTFKLSPVTSALLLALAAQIPANLAYANAGFGTVTDLTNTNVAVPTYFASSPQGIRPAFDLVTGLSGSVTVDTGAPIRKFVDSIGGVYNGLESSAAMSDLAAGIPVAITEKWVNLAGLPTTDDFYEIAVVEYTEQMHSDLAKPTRLRGYVQIETPNIVAKGLKDITGAVGSEHILATYPDGTPIKDAKGNQVYFTHKPHYLGPVILAAHGTPVRIKFDNYLPYTDATGKSVGSWNGTGGELAIPVDETIPGGGAILDKNGVQIKGKNGLPIKMGQNRVAIHWHGGDTPWTGDGTPHQWFAPKGDISYTLQQDNLHPHGQGKGVSAQDVPDMQPTNDGEYTLYYPNQEMSGRLMFYHDHASGLTRLNVYDGTAAGYVVYDPTELALAASTLNTPLNTVNAAGLPTGLLDAVGIPLVLQDKTFVPKNIGPNAKDSAGNPASQDAKWDLNHWGQPGDLFFPHVYETNQDPNSIDGTNPVGRWDWGPWFWPVFPAQYSLPTGNYGDITTTPEAFMDTALVNGKAYPTMTVDPKTYRFRILSAGNDRTLNLNLYQAVDGAGKVCDASNTAPTPNPTQIYPATATAASSAQPATCTEVRTLPAAPTPGFPATWPTDGRAGGVPDPATAGPDIVQIGNEGGLMPAVAVWKAQPVVFEQDVRSITIFNILNHGLLLMPAERADAFIDFSNYAGQTLILYNDGPAPAPGYDPRIDYFTGVGDQTAAGGAYDTLPGYGPNTRTFMQIKVNATNTSGTGGRLNVQALATALPVAYAATQPAPIIPQSVYNAAFGTNSVDSYAKIGTGSNTAPYFVPNGTTFAVTGFKVTSGGSNYPAGTTATFSAPQAGGTTATATPVVTNGVITGFTNFNAGSGYTNTSPLTVTFSAPGAGGKAASATVTTTGYAVINKAIQELFDPVYGRMNATLAAELPFSAATVATTIPLSYTDTPIDYLDGIKEGETQIWKITHNGVDSHPVHFHLVNVQLINRVGWDGVVKPPAPNEVGWRETIRMNPLEDVYVVATAKHPVVPFGLPTSSRLLDPSAAVGATAGLTNIDPLTGAAPTFQTQLVNGVSTNVATTQYSNQMTDFDNEYVWHCHILGHEEFDFMRPMVFHPNVVVPDAPAKVTLSGNTVTWTDTTPYGGQDADGIPTAGVNAAYPSPISSPKNEIGFKIYFKPTIVNGQVTAPATPDATVPANVTTWTSTSASALPATTVVVAYNAAGNSAAGNSATTTAATTTMTAPGAATATGVLTVTGSIDATGYVVTPASTAGLVVGASVSGGGFPVGTTIAAISGATFTTSLASTQPGASVTLTISKASIAATTTAAGPAGLTQATNSTGTVTLNWGAVPGAISYTVTVTETLAPVSPATVGVTQAPVTLPLIGIVPPATAPATSITTSVLNPGSTYTFAVSATTLSGTTAATTTGLTNSPLWAPVGFAASQGAVNSGTVSLQWANDARNKNNVASMNLTVTNGPVGGVTFKPNSTGATVTGLTTGTSYTFSLTAVSNVSSFSSGPVTQTITAP